MWTAIHQTGMSEAGFQPSWPRRRRLPLFFRVGLAVAAVIAVSLTAVTYFGDSIQSPFSSVANLSRAREIRSGIASKVAPPGEYVQRNLGNLAALGYVATVGNAANNAPASASIPFTAQARSNTLSFPVASDLGSTFASDSGSAASPRAGRRARGGLSDADSRILQAEQAAESEEKRPSASEQTTDAKIIKTGDLAVEVEGYSEAFKQVERIVAEHGAVIADVATQEQTGGALVGRVVIRVAPQRFEPLFAALKAVGRLEAENVKSADVTAEYVDIEARIHSLLITEERLRELVKNKSFIDNISALLEVERELTRVRSQIESYQGQLRVMADRVARSTITITLREPVRTVPSASYSIEVSTLDEASAALSEALQRAGARTMSGKTNTRSDGTLLGDYKLEVSLARLEELLKEIESLGRVAERQLRDYQFGTGGQAWAKTVDCLVSLKLFERSRHLPAGTIKIEIEALNPALETLEVLLTAANAATKSGNTRQLPDGSAVADIKIRVPAGRFADLTESLKSLGRTTGKSLAGEAGAITGGAASVPCDLSLTLTERVREVPQGTMTLEVDEFERARDAVSALVTDKNIHVLKSSSSQRTDGTWSGRFTLGIKADEMEGVVRKLESLGRVQSRQITGLGLGDLSQMDPDALGVIELSLAEKSAITPGPDLTAGSIRQRFRGGLTGMYASVGTILFGLMVAAPWILAASVVVGIIVWLRRKPSSH